MILWRNRDNVGVRYQGISTARATAMGGEKATTTACPSHIASNKAAVASPYAFTHTPPRLLLLGLS